MSPGARRAARRRCRCADRRRAVRARRAATTRPVVEARVSTADPSAAPTARSRGEIPAEDDAVAVAARSARPRSSAVEVLVVGDDGRAELDEVEVRVAAHERVRRPRDRARAALERPAALELLQREAERAALELAVDAGDVRVEVELGAVEAEEPERDADESVAVERAGDEVAGVRERSQQARRRLRVAVRRPRCAPISARSRVELGKRVERADDDPARSAARRAVCGGLLRAGHAWLARVEFGTRHRQIVPRVVRLRHGPESQPPLAEVWLRHRMACGASGENRHR